VLDTGLEFNSYRVNGIKGSVGGQPVVRVGG